MRAYSHSSFCISFKFAQTACEPSGRIVGFAHIEYEYPEDAGAALLASHYRPYVLHERTLWVRPAKGESKSPSVIPIRMPEEDRRYISDHGVHPTFPPSRFLWVGGMRPSVRRRELAKVFSPVCGADNILKVHIGMTQHSTIRVRRSSNP